MSDDRQNSTNSVIVLKPTTPTTEQLSAFLTGLKNVELHFAETPVELIQLVNQLQPCIVLMSVATPQQLPSIMSALKGQHSLAKRGRVKTMLVSKVKNPQLRTAVQKLNVAEFIEEPISGKTLQFKASLQIKALEALKKRDADLKAQKEAIEIRKGEANTRQEPYPADAKMLPQMELENDSFTFRGSKVKKQNQRIQFDLGGPDPASGDWVQHKSMEEGKTAWRWLPKDPNEQAALGGPDGNDGWIAEGEMPVFEPLRKKWGMAGKAPELYYKKDGKVVGKKVTTNKLGDLEVAEDSSRAEEKVRRALESLGKRNESGHEVHQDLGSKEKPSQIHDIRDRSDPENSSRSNATTIGSEKARSRLRDERRNDEKVEKGSSAERLRDKFGNDKASNAANVAQGESEESNKLDRFKSLREKKRKQADGEPDDLRSIDEGEDKAPVFDLIRPDRKPEGMRDQRKEADGKELYGDTQEAKADPNEIDLGRPNRKNKAAAQAQKGAVESPFSPLKSKRPERGTSSQAAVSKLGKDPKSPDVHEDLSGGESESGMHLDLRTPEKIDEFRANRKRKIMDDIQREMNRPIAKKLSREDRQALAAEINKPQTDLSDEELGKAAKLGRLKRLKKKLQDVDTALDFDDPLDEESTKTSVHDLRPETKALRPPLRRPVTPDEKSKWSGHDSDQETKDTEWTGHKSEAAAKNGRRDAKPERPVFHVPLRDIAVPEPAWERAEPYYVCLSASTSYRGFDTLAHLLPLWCYEGASKPELLVKESAWRFYDREPIYCRVLTEIPVEVKSYLLELNARIKSDGNTEELSEREKRDLENRREKRAKSKEDSTPKTKAEELKKKEAKLAALDGQLKNATEPSPEEAAESGMSVAELRREREAKMREEMAKLAEEISAAREEMAAKQAALGDSSLYEEKEENAENSSASAPLDAEEEEFEEPAEPTSSIADKPMSPADKMAELRRKLGEDEPSAPITEALEEKVKNSEAADFLAKRRERKEAAARQEDPAGENHGDPVETIADNASAADVVAEESIGRKHKEFESATLTKTDSVQAKKAENALSETLGIALLISDALYEGKNLIKRPDALLRVISQCFGACVAQLAELQGNGKTVLIGSQEEGEPAGTEVSISLTEPTQLAYTDSENVIVASITVRLAKGASGRDLGYVRLKAIAPRKTFTAADYRVLEAIAINIAEYWSALLAAESKERRAA